MRKRGRVQGAGARAKQPVLADAAIEAVASEYSEKAISRVRACLTFRCRGRVSGAHECMALAAAHRLAADACELLAGAIAGGRRRGYCAPTVEIGASHGDTVTARISIELVDGTQAEADLALELLHDAVPAPA